MPNIPVIALIGPKFLDLKSLPEVPWFETNELDVRHYENDRDITGILVRDRPDVIITIGDPNGFPNLNAQSYEVRKKWLNFESDIDPESIGRAAYNCFAYNIASPRTAQPLVSVITPTYRTGWRIMRCYQSLVAQTHNNWEWVVVDDSNDGGETYRMLTKLAEADHRIRLVQQHRHSGKIGETKYMGFMLGRGQYLAELDHDDELTPQCLEWVVAAGEAHPEGGFIYSDCTELFETGGCVDYGEHFAFGYGSYRKETYRGQELLVSNQQNLNPKTIRHIVGVPNHIRVWKRDCYHRIGGHNPDLHVADDYEIMIRTFLDTRVVRVPKLGYVQYMNAGGNNTQNVRRSEIQRLVRYLVWNYDRRIHDRLVELGIDDYLWDEATGHAATPGSVPNPEVEQHCSIIANIQ